jgi:hypothetical protein
MGTSKREVNRLTNLKHAAKIYLIGKAFNALDVTET